MDDEAGKRGATAKKKSRRKNRNREKMGLQEDFEQHAELVKTLKTKPSNEDLLILYGLYKQATVGPVNTDRPGIFSMKERAKWDSWKSYEAKSKEEAMSDYITKVKQLMEADTASS
ncbi:Acyl-CoA-binding protein [Rhynchospora pubera]|uniref:Acyl-CoA-binding protein n=1 Tax=Rhynchospora pubera TaxID=906938 RepID=A0AAV8EG13_9POAL|nr:Acyl-CoA-binding protein [Rhynchospora pubera]